MPIGDINIMEREYLKMCLDFHFPNHMVQMEMVFKYYSGPISKLYTYITCDVSQAVLLR